MEAAASNSTERPVTTKLCSRFVRTTYCWWMSSIGCQDRGLESIGGASRRRRLRWWMACPWWHSVPSRVQLHSNTSFVPRELEHTCGTLKQVHVAAWAIRLCCACPVGCPSTLGAVSRRGKQLPAVSIYLKLAVFNDNPQLIWWSPLNEIRIASPLSPSTMQLRSLPPFFFPYLSSTYNPQASSENTVCVLDSGKGKGMLIIDGDRAGADNLQPSEFQSVVHGPQGVREVIFFLILC